MVGSGAHGSVLPTGLSNNSSSGRRFVSRASFGMLSPMVLFWSSARQFTSSALLSVTKKRTSTFEDLLRAVQTNRKERCCTSDGPHSISCKRKTDSRRRATCLAFLFPFAALTALREEPPATPLALDFLRSCGQQPQRRSTQQRESGAHAAELAGGQGQAHGRLSAADAGCL